MRPELTSDLSTDDFAAYYWLKAELQTFCRAHGISPSGGKEELAARISHFLATGEVQKPQRARTAAKPKAKTEDRELTLDTVIGENHRCSQRVRAFLKQAIGPSFHFSTYIQNYFKGNPEHTYRDAIVAWHAEQERKKDPAYQKEIGPQFEYNRYIRDYFLDPANKGKSRVEAIASWNRVKQLSGSRQYKPELKN